MGEHVQGRSLAGALSGAVLAVALLCAGAAQAAYIIEVDTDGLDDGVLTYNTKFSFGGDTTTASQSITSPAFGTTGGDSIFGGDGVNLPDTYVFTYAPTTDPDNLVIPAGTNLGGGNLASGFVGGGTGTYRVYATWPYTENVSGGDTRYTIVTTGDSVIVDINQNGAGSVWVLLGDIDYSDATASIQVTQTPTTGGNTFVSMRAYGLLFERIDTGSVPEPGTLALLGLGLAGLAATRRRKQ